jgi:hypothetical protein
MGSHLEDFKISELRKLCEIIDVQPDKSRTKMIRKIREVDTQKLTVAKLKEIFELVELSNPV